MTSSGTGSDSSPQDPFDRPPNESGTSPTQPIQPYPGSAPGPDQAEPTISLEKPEQPEQPGYWERQAGEQQAGSAPPYAANPYGQPPQGPPQGFPQTGYPPQQGYGQPGYPPQQGYAAPYAYGQPGYGYAMAPTHSSATTSLVLGLVGLIGGLLCGLGFFVSPFAIVVGRKTIREIDASNGQLGGRSNAKAGLVLGIVGSVILVLGVLAVVLIIIAGIAGSSGSSTEF